MSDESKTCRTCGEAKPLATYYRSKNGRFADCRECMKMAHALKPDVPPQMEGEKTCTWCKATKPIVDFPRARKVQPDGRHQQCKECHSAREKKRREDDPALNLKKYRSVGRNSELKRRYGISVERYDELLAAQGGGCAICGRKPEHDFRHMAVDHDHAHCNGRRSCGEYVRGILCNQCNHGLACFKDNPRSLRAAAVYLEQRE